MAVGEGGLGGSFDGIICIGGEDWWYHNRGHFDFQIMRRIARSWPVLFVNSLAVRMPNPARDRHFVAKVSRKLQSFAHGVVNVENNFWVYSPVSVPGPVGQKLSGFALAPQIRAAARRAGISRPLVWMHCPAGAALIGKLAEVATVLQRTDRFEAFPEADPAVVGAQIAELKARADLTVYCNSHLMAEEQGQVRRQILVTHGVDFEMFAKAGARTPRELPEDVKRIRGPRVGFVGGIDAHTFAPEMFVKTAAALPNVSFVLIGGCSLPEDWCPWPNVHLLGRKPYEAVASYMAAMDVLVMPWNDSDWIKACNPIKLKEYLAVGRPVVTTDFPALDGWRDLVFVAKGGAEFATAIRTALASAHDAEAARQRVRPESWDAKAELVRRSILELGLAFEGSASAATDRAAGLAASAG